MKYYIIAQRGKSQKFLVESLPAPIDINLSGYVYDIEQGKLFPAGAEVFMRGYWENAEGEIEIDDNNNRPRQPEPQT